MADPTLASPIAAVSRQQPPAAAEWQTLFEEVPAAWQRWRRVFEAADALGRHRTVVDPVDPHPILEALGPHRHLSLAGMSGALEAAMKASAIGTGAFGWEPDRRTPEDYAKEVDAYIAKASKALPSALLKGAHARGLGRIGFLVRNNTDDPIHGLQVEVRIPAKGVMALHEDEIPAKDLPARPVMLGKGGRNRFDYLGGVSLAGLMAPRYDLMTPAMGSLGRRVRIDNSNSVLLTFDPLDLYAADEADLEEVFLLVHPDLAGTTLTADWSARSRDASGVVRDTLEIEVDATVQATDELLAHADESADQDEDDGDDED